MQYDHVMGCCIAFQKKHQHEIKLKNTVLSKVSQIGLSMKQLERANS